MNDATKEGPSSRACRWHECRAEPARPTADDTLAVRQSLPLHHAADVSCGGGSDHRRHRIAGHCLRVGRIERASWVVVSYLIANTIAAPVYGRLGDTYGRRGMISLRSRSSHRARCSAPCPQHRIPHRDARAAGIWRRRIDDAVASAGRQDIPPRERGRYQGYLAGVAVASSTFGPVAGGYLTQAFGWQSIFLVNVPLGLIAFFWCCG